MATYVGGTEDEPIEERVNGLLDLDEALRNFVSAAWKLESAMSYIDLPVEVDEIGCDAGVRIPFNRSYDEWVYDLQNWAEAAEADIKRLISETEQGI